MNFLSPPSRGAGRPGFLIPVFFLLLCLPLSSQELYRGTLPLSLAGFYTALPTCPSASANQAALGWSDENLLSLQQWQPFIIKEISVSGLSAVFHLFPGRGSVAFNTFGMPGYHRSALWLSYGMRLGSGCSAGIGFRTQLVSVKGDLTYKWQTSVSGGILVKINDRLIAGAHLTDPLYVPANKTPLSGPPTELAAGLDLESTPGLHLYLQLSYSTYRQGILILATTWQANERLAFHAGYSTLAHTCSLGTTCTQRNWEICVAVPWIPGTGLSPSLRLTRTLKK